MKTTQNFINVNDSVVAFDCDDTLVMWTGKEWEPADYKVAFNCPITLMGDGQVIRTDTVYLVPHKKHIQKLKGYAKNGWFVIVWSAGGGAWAKEVVRVLNLENHVNLITGKPVWCYDDLPLSEGIGQRKYYLDRKHE